MEGSVVRDSSCTVDKVLARCEPLTNFAARAAAVGKLPSLPSPAGEVSRRLATKPSS